MALQTFNVLLYWSLGLMVMLIRPLLNA